MSASPLNRHSAALYGAELTQPSYQQRIAKCRKNPMSNHRNTVDALNAELRGFNRKPVAASNVAPVVMSKLALALKEANAALHALAFKLRAARKAGKKS